MRSRGITFVRTGIAGLATAVALTLAVAPTHANNPVTPGDFTGYGFDQCVAPTQKAMTKWLNHSPYLAVGIYISGDSRGCRNQPNLTPEWISRQLAAGWRLLPLTVGPQASCRSDFPRYGDDKKIDPAPANNYAAARKQGRQEASKTVAVALELGIVEESTLWYDLESFNTTITACRESALAFLSGWTSRLHSLNYVSGVYSSAATGIRVLDQARINRPDDFTFPDRIWIAMWDQNANVDGSPYISDDGWHPGHRMKQYRGPKVETHGGVSINVDANWLDLGTGSKAPREAEHCGGVNLNFRYYLRLERGSTKQAQIKALQCLLKEQGFFAVDPTGIFGRSTVRAIGAWQEARGLPQDKTWTRKQWAVLVSYSAKSSPVVKFGSASPAVRRAQRALNALTQARLTVTGVFDNATRAALKEWQTKTDQPSTGVVAPWTWKRFGRV